MPSPQKILFLTATALWLVGASLSGWAQNSPPDALTAEEYLAEGNRFYTAGQWKQAHELYERFLTDYGANLEIKPYLSRAKYLTVMTLVQMKQYDAALDAIARAEKADPPLSQTETQEVAFWKGVCQLQEEQYAPARGSLEQFIALFPAGATAFQFPSLRKVPDARILIGTSYLLEGSFAKAAEYFAALRPQLPDFESQGRAVVLELYALLEAGENDRALALVSEAFPHLNRITQLAAFQTMTLQLGAQLLEAGKLQQSAACLQRVWPKERILKHQTDKLADLRARLDAMEANPRSDPYQKLLLTQMIGKVQRELESFAKVQNFDSALRLRLAASFQARERYREAALLMEAMLRDMPPDPVVESASVNLVQSWSAIERWPKAIEAAQRFAEKFPESAQRPLVLYLQGLAEQKNRQYPEALASFQKIVSAYPKSDFAPRAQFMVGFTHLLAEQNADAINAFTSFAKKYPKHEMADAAAYWLGMAYSLDRQFEQAIAAMDAYLNNYPQGTYRDRATFRKGYAVQQLMNYPEAITQLRAYLNKYPGAEENDEALVLLGDAYMNEGQMDLGIAAFKRINPQNTRFFEEGWFKVGKAYKLMEEPEKLRDHMMEFRREHPRSPRVAEALYWVGWVERQNGNIEGARQVYWDAIEEFGNDPAIRSVDDLFPALAKLYKGPEEQAQFLARLDDLAEEARRRKKAFLALRASWAKANQQKRQNPDESARQLASLAKSVPVESTNPLVLADIAEALQLSGQDKAAEQMWADLLKWNPRAPQKDRALAALGLAALQRGHTRKALDYFERFSRESTGSILTGKVLLAKAELLEKRGEGAKAREALEGVLSNQASPGSEKAQALFQIGEIYMREGKPNLAIPYFQRIYVMYGRWSEWVAKAYYRSGEAFEKLQDTEAARKTFQELAEKEELAELPEFKKAQDRLKTMGGPA